MLTAQVRLMPAGSWLSRCLVSKTLELSVSEEPPYVTAAATAPALHNSKTAERKGDRRQHAHSRWCVHMGDRCVSRGLCPLLSDDATIL